MQHTCRQCSAPFEVTQDDLAFYEKVSPTFGGKKELIPAPTLCPLYRLQRRMSWRNDRTLHHRKSDLTGKQIISMYSADKPLKVYDQDEWWSDRWNALEYGRDFDFSRTFAEQFDALSRDVPHISLYVTNNQNSYYTNHTLNLKNCYLIAGGGNDEDCMYGRFLVNCKDTLEGSSLYSCERCYEGGASEKCYGCLYFQYSRNCSDCIMVQDCQGCSHCICCFGLRNKKYCIFNQEVGKEAYEERLKELLPLTREKIDLLRKKLLELSLRLPHRASHIYASEECTGDMIVNSKNCQWAFDASDCEDSIHMCFTPKGIDSRDCTFTAPDGTEQCYDVCSTVGARGCFATFLLWYGNDVFYSTECHHCNNCFGCVGLRRNQYCIFNKQYTKEEYETLVPRIIDHMRKTGEWGEFLPTAISRFCYNESVAQEFFPLDEKEVRRRGWKWFAEPQTQEQYLGPPTEIPADIRTVPDSVTEQILRCSVTGKPYRITQQELKFYRDMHLPIPQKSPDQRYRERMTLRNPRRLWRRNCAKCQKPIETTYSPERKEIVYCESCYLATVY